MITIHEYFRKKYGLDLMAPSLPIVQTTKKGVMFPPEVCHLVPGQRYMHKLDESQVSELDLLIMPLLTMSRLRR